MGNEATVKGKNSARAKATPRKRSVKIQPNPVAERTNLDAYDALLAMDAPRARKAPPRRPAAKRAPAPKRPGARDPYDEFIERAERAERGRRAQKPMDEFDRYIARIEGKARKAKPRKPAEKGRARTGGGRGGASWLLTTLILLCFLLIGARLYGYADFIKMRNAVARATFFDGTYLEGVDLSGMTFSDAAHHWEADIEPAYAGRSVTLDDGTAVTAGQMGYKSDARAMLESIWNAQRAGTLKERYQNLRAQAGARRDYPVARSFYDEAVLKEFAAYVASGVDRAGAEAAVTGFDPASYSFTFSRGEAAVRLDQEKLIRDIAAALAAGGGQVAREIATTMPKLTAAALSERYGLIASATTNASSSSSGRLANIKLSVDAINGTKLEPGEEFSFNGVVGQRTAARGYQMAPAFSGGEVTEELGGGICQVSTTLFNAAVKSDLNITERHAHSMPVSYVDKGKDATVNWGSQDLKFKNNTSGPVYIMAVVSKDKKVKIGIFGEKLKNGVTITVDAEVTDTYQYKTNYQVNAFLRPGETNVLQAGRTGYRAVAYKVRWSADGKLLEKEPLYTSTYRQRDAIIEVPQN